MGPDDLKKAVDAIFKTGYPLEHQVTSILTENGWNTINNRYYVDQDSDTVREIDILAYRVSTYKDIAFYTVLILSCKKSENNFWSFLTRELPAKDLNFNYFPIKVWSNDEILDYMLKSTSWDSSVRTKTKKEGAFSRIYGFEKQVFAFQEISRKKFTCQNDKAIYSSLNSLISALEYEKKALNSRVEKNLFTILI